MAGPSGGRLGREGRAGRGGRGDGRGSRVDGLEGRVHLVTLRREARVRGVEGDERGEARAGRRRRARGGGGGGGGGVRRRRRRRAAAAVARSMAASAGKKRRSSMPAQDYSELNARVRCVPRTDKPPAGPHLGTVPTTSAPDGQGQRSIQSRVPCVFTLTLTHGDIVEEGHEYAVGVLGRHLLPGRPA